MEINEEIRFDYTLFLTTVHRLCSLVGMARLRDIIRGLSEETTKQHRGLISANDELARLRDAARRFRALEESVRTGEESLKIGLALLFNVPQKANINADAYSSTYREELDDMRDLSGVIIDPKEDLDLSHFPLWKVMREVLKQTAEIRVYELENHLQSFGVKAARSAIESALLTHKKDFRVTKRGREKFVSLK